MKSSYLGLDRRRITGSSLLAAVLDHQVDQLDEVLADLPHAHALNTGVGALEQHREEIGGENRVLETGGLAQSYDTLVRADLVLLNDAPRRMVWVGQLRQRVAQGGTALFHLPELGRGASTPVLKQALRITAVLGGEVLPLFFLVGDHAADPFGDELVLRVEVAVEGHLVGLRRFRDRFTADAADPLLVKQIASRHQNPLANGQARPAPLLRLRPVVVNICLHAVYYPSLTKMLPTGNIGVIRRCYRSVTYYKFVRSATTNCCSSSPPPRSRAT